MNLFPNLRRGARAALTAATVSLTLATAPAIAGPPRVSFHDLAPGTRHQQFIVMYRGQSGVHTGAPASQQALDRAARGTGLQGLSLHASRRLGIGAALVRASRPLDAVEAERLLRQFAEDPAVEFAQVDAFIRPDYGVLHGTESREFAATERASVQQQAPNDPRYPEQWGFNAASGINAEPAWDRAQGEGILIGVLDTGRTTHSDVSPNIISGGYDFVHDDIVGNDGDGRDADPTDPGDWSGSYASTWHGTIISGLLAAITNNGVGVAGTAYKSKMLHVRVMGKGGGYLSDITDGIVWAAGGSVPKAPVNPTPVKVMNLSLGAQRPCDATVQAAVDLAVGRGITLVAAAGNGNTYVNAFTPANCKNVIAVSAVDSNGVRPSFANVGAGVDVSAPGVKVLSSTNAGATGPGQETYKAYDGTSVAAPYVTGIVALIQSAVKQPLTPARIEEIIKTTARPFPTPPEFPIGTGIADAARAMEEACKNNACKDGDTGKPPVAGFTATVSGLKASFTDTSTDADGQVVEWLWDFGDGGSDKTRNPTHTYAKAGTYTVKLSVRDNSGKSASTQQSVEVKEIPSGNELQNNVPVNVAGAQGSEVYYTLQLPESQSRLVFTLKGGSGDADLYVRHGQKPTTSSYDCRPYKSGNDEVCEMTPKAGTWHVLVRGYRAFDGATLTASYAGGGGGTKTYANEDDVTIVDKQTVRSAIAVSGREGAKGQPATRINVAIAHTYIGDLTVSLQAPSGQRWVLHNRSGGSADDVRQAYTLDLSAESLEGEWVLLVADAANGDTGRIERWDITF